MKNLAAALALLALTVAPAVHAQDGAAYYGVAFGEFDYSEDIDGVDDTVSSWRLMVNYQFMEHLAVEGTFGQTSTIRDTVTVPAFPSGTVDLQFSAQLERILTVRLLGVLPLDNLKLMAGLGYSDFKFSFGYTDGVDSLSGDVDRNEPGYYFGVQYDWDRFAMRLGYEKFDFGGSEDATESTLSFFYKL